MKTEPAKRRERSRRQGPRNDMAAAVSQFAVKTPRWYPPSPSWAGNLWGRDGWHGVQVAQRPTLVIFLVHFRWQTYYIDCTGCRLRGSLFRFSSAFCPWAGLKLLRDLWESLQDKKDYRSIRACRARGERARRRWPYCEHSCELSSHGAAAAE